MSLPLVLGLLWAAVIVVWGWRARPQPIRTPTPLSSRKVSNKTLMGAGFVLAAAIAIGVEPALGLGLGLFMWFIPRRRRIQQRRREQAVIADELPEAVDLLRLAVSSGLNVHLAVTAVGERLTGPVGQGLAGAAEKVRDGLRLADALESLPEAIGEAVRPLVRVLIDGDRYGTDLEPALEQVAYDSRMTRRRQTEERVRRLPLQLLLPLVTCILPAFIFLTLAPVVVETVASLRA